MQLEVGKIVEGKVTGITKFGAFVELETGEVGMVHISEVAPTYVNDISEHLQVGQTVKVKVLAINDDKKISLSIKKAMPQQREFSKDRPQNNNGNRPRFTITGLPATETAAIIITIITAAGPCSRLTNALRQRDLLHLRIC